MKKLFSLLMFVGLAIMFTSCGHYKNSSDAKLNAQQEQLMQEGTRQIGMPAIVNFQERKMAKMILELRDQENLICYAYVYSDFHGKFRFIGKCLGYGLPYATQFTNPQKEVYAGGYNNGFGSLPQADPNGLFMPASAEATWIMLLDSAGTPHPMYFEPKMTILPFPLPNSVLFKD